MTTIILIKPYQIIMNFINQVFKEKIKLIMRKFQTNK